MFKCGIIGLPNVGKSTLFNALTRSSVKTENFPFCTIEPNKGFISILDNRIIELMQFISSDVKITYANIQIIDVAGLIQGASQGAGLGNQFLYDISQVHVLFHVVRCFADIDICHVTSQINPKYDINVVNNELILTDIEICEKKIHHIQNSIQNKFKNIKSQVTLLNKCLNILNQGILLNRTIFTKSEHDILQDMNFLTLKPMIYIANINNTNINHDINSTNNYYLSNMNAISIKHNVPYISICVLSEAKAITSKVQHYSLSCTNKKLVHYNNLSDIIRIMYQIMKLKTFFTFNTKEIRSWIVKNNTSALNAADMIHSDFKKGFIRVQVIRYKDFIAYQGQKNTKQAGKLRFEGKDYIISDGDILKFLYKV